VLIATSCLTLTRQTMQALFQAPPPSSRESGGGESEHGQQGEGVARASGSAAAAGGPQGGRHARPVAGSVPHLLSLREVDLRDSSRTDSRLPLNPERFQVGGGHSDVCSSCVGHRRTGCAFDCPGRVHDIAHIRQCEVTSMQLRRFPDDLLPHTPQACAPHLQVLRLGGLGGVWGWDVGQYCECCWWLGGAHM
jgi:hypothetical protein